MQIAAILFVQVYIQYIRPNRIGQFTLRADSAYYIYIYIYIYIYNIISFEYVPLYYQY